jgi:osmotically-inducible protein OsmY
MVLHRAIVIGAMALGMVVGACDRGEAGKVDLKLDSAGSKIERGVKEVGKELDTAWTGVKTELSEAQIQMLLRKLNGLDKVEVTLTAGGDVTLTGTVANADRKKLAGMVTAEIQGVHGVTNTIAIAPGAAADSAAADSTSR